jgi:hypothetical protein
VLQVQVGHQYYPYLLRSLMSYILRLQLLEEDSTQARLTKEKEILSETMR